LTMAKKTRMASKTIFRLKMTLWYLLLYYTTGLNIIESTRLKLLSFSFLRSSINYVQKWIHWISDTSGYYRKLIYPFPICPFYGYKNGSISLDKSVPIFVLNMSPPTSP
jgi:hypothetical protein